MGDFLRKMQMTVDIYGDDTDMIKGLTSNTKTHEKEKIKVINYMHVVMLWSSSIY